MTVYEPLSPASLDTAVAFMREANPFAQLTWGWDTGRFVDWRWGSNMAHETERPGWFSDHCTVVVESGAIRALVISEDGGDDLCILTTDPDQTMVSRILADVIEERRMLARQLSFEAATRSEWLRDVFDSAGLLEQQGVGHEWEYDLTSHLPGAAAPPGFTISSLAEAEPGDHDGIADCIAAAFGTTRDLRATLSSIEVNPLFKAELSVFVRSPDGRIAAYCRGTVDPHTGVSGIDPVCTHPDFQRLGLGRAVVTRCFEEQRNLGGNAAYIGSAPEPAPATRLYQSLGPRDRIDMSAWTLPER